MSPIRRSEFLGRPSLLVVHPVESAGEGGRPIGFFVERPDLRELEAILAPLPSDPPPAFWLIDGEGHVRLGRVETEPGVSTFPGEMPPPGADTGPVREAAFPGLGEVVYGVRRLNSGGFLAVTVPAAAAYRSLDEARTSYLTFRTGEASTATPVTAGAEGRIDLIDPGDEPCPVLGILYATFTAASSLGCGALESPPAEGAPNPCPSASPSQSPSPSPSASRPVPRPRPTGSL